jgi:hypothetical protein
MNHHFSVICIILFWKKSKKKETVLVPLINMFWCDMQPTVRAAGAVRDVDRPQLDRDPQEEGHVHVGVVSI